jgi:protein O-mannosyl-transferase
MEKEEHISKPSGYSKYIETNKIIKIAICILLVVSTVVVYWQIQDNEFLNYDDPIYVTENLNVKAGFTRESIIWAFTTSHDTNWFPITWLSHILDYQLYGSNPKGHHLTNLLLHIVSVLLLFIVLLRMTGAFWQSSFVSALFALHPLNVESVAWIAERKNVLSTFFWLLTMLAYVFYTENTNLKRYGLVVLFFALGLMSKPMLVTLPFVLLLMDYWPLNRQTSFFCLIWEKIPLLLLAAGSSITTYMVQKSGGALYAMEVNSLSARIGNAMVLYLEYLKKALWPSNLALFYYYPGNNLIIWKALLSGLVLAGISVFSIRLIKKAPYVSFGWFWYLGSFVPAIQIVQTSRHGMADRYAYIPLIGIFIIIAWGLPELMAKWRIRRKALIIMAGIYIPMLMLVAWNQTSHWKNNISIFKHAIKATDKSYPDFALAHLSLGNALLDQGKTAEAIYQYNIAVKLKPGAAISHYNLANALVAQGRNREAISQYNIALMLWPEYDDARHNLNEILQRSK